MNIHYVLELGKWLKLCFLTIQLEGVTSTSGITGSFGHRPNFQKQQQGDPVTEMQHIIELSKKVGSDSDTRDSHRILHAAP